MTNLEAIRAKVEKLSQVGVYQDFMLTHEVKPIIDLLLQIVEKQNEALKNIQDEPYQKHQCPVEQVNFWPRWARIRVGKTLEEVNRMIDSIAATNGRGEMKP